MGSLGGSCIVSICQSSKTWKKHRVLVRILGLHRPKPEKQNEYHKRLVTCSGLWPRGIEADFLSHVSIHTAQKRVNIIASGSSMDGTVM